MPFPSAELNWIPWLLPKHSKVSSEAASSHFTLCFYLPSEYTGSLLLSALSLTQQPSMLESRSHCPRDLFQYFWTHSTPWVAGVVIPFSHGVSCLPLPMVHLTLPFNEGHSPCKYHIKHIGNWSTERFPSRKVTAERYHFSLLPLAIALEEGPCERQKVPTHKDAL